MRASAEGIVVQSKGWLRSEIKSELKKKRSMTYVVHIDRSNHRMSSSLLASHPSSK